MSVWTWVRQFAAEAVASGDERRLALYELFREANDVVEDSLDSGLQMLERGRRLALELREPWWALFFEHWKLQYLLNHGNDNTRALPLAVAATVEARKPVYAGCPQRLCVHDDLISAYLALDAPGYAAEVEEAIGYMQSEVSEDVECRFCILQNRAELADALDRTADLKRTAAGLLATAQESGDYSNATFGWAWLCLIAWREGDMLQLTLRVAEGLALSDEVDLPVHKAEFLAWQACLARHDGHEREAAFHLRQAEATLARTQRPPSSRYFEALRAFHGLKSDRERQLLTCERELTTLEGMSQHHREAVARIERCRLLAELGRPLGQAAEEARQVIGRLRRPGEMRARLEAVIGA